MIEPQVVALSKFLSSGCEPLTGSNANPPNNPIAPDESLDLMYTLIDKWAVEDTGDLSFIPNTNAGLIESFSTRNERRILARKKTRATPIGSVEATTRFYYKCTTPQCTKTFEAYSLWMAHCRLCTKATPAPTMRCDQCHRLYKSETSLALHIKTMH